ncbi:hypothetical protein KCU98_g11909, partial [Aureobasidium melanogenum]
MLATYSLALSGTPFMLAGQEIGMEEYGPRAYIDVEARIYYEAVLKTRGGGDVMREIQLKARDHGRLPMQWESTWRKMLALREENTDLLTYGSYTPMSEGDIGEKVPGYERQCHETSKTAVVLLNFSDREQKVQIRRFAQREFEVLISNKEPNIKAHNVTLMPHGATIKASYVTLMPYGAVVLVDKS